MDGQKAEMVFTDPPYALFGNSTGVHGIADDKMVRPFFRDIGRASMEWVENFGHVYLCCDWHTASVIQSVIGEVGLTAKNLCVWDKGDGGIGANYQQCYELIWFFTNSPRAKGTMARKEAGEKTVNGVPNIWRFPRVQKDRIHNAEKPVGMVSVPITNGSKQGNIVLDFFSGSGTVLIACEQLGRKCRAIEISPAYVAVAIQRWADATGKTPNLAA
jgi:DNA modification methylase